MRGLTFFVDSSTGELVRVRNDVYTVDVDGSVSGMLTPGLDPDIAGNEPGFVCASQSQRRLHHLLKYARILPKLLGVKAPQNLR